MHREHARLANPVGSIMPSRSEHRSHADSCMWMMTTMISDMLYCRFGTSAAAFAALVLRARRRGARQRPCGPSHT
eukprot:6128784-Pyramimonas_sp.AAC.1